MSELGDALRAVHREEQKTRRSISVTIGDKTWKLYGKELTVAESVAIRREAWDRELGTVDPDKQAISRLLRMAVDENGKPVFDVLEREMLIERVGRERLASMYLTLSAAVQEGRESGKVVIQLDEMEGSSD